MKRLLSILQRLINKIPMPLPTGMSAWNQWSKRILSKVGPVADNDSLEYVLASQVMHLSPQSDHIPDQYFISALRKAAANQVASQVFMDIKIRQQKAAEHYAAQQPLSTVEVTPAPESVTSNGQKAE